MFFGHDWPILGKMGAGTSPAECEVFCVVIHVTFRQLRNGWFSRNLLRCPVEESGKTFSKIFTLGSFAPKIWNRKLVKEAPHSEQATVHGMHCREILFAPLVVQGPGHFQDLVNFFVRRTVAELRGVKVKLPNFWILVYFPYTKPLKHTFRWPACSPGVTSQNHYDFSTW